MHAVCVHVHVCVLVYCACISQCVFTSWENHLWDGFPSYDTPRTRSNRDTIGWALSQALSKTAYTLVVHILNTHTTVLLAGHFLRPCQKLYNMQSLSEEQVTTHTKSWIHSNAHSEMTISADKHGHVRPIPKVSWGNVYNLVLCHYAMCYLQRRWLRN